MSTLLKKRGVILFLALLLLGCGQNVHRVTVSERSSGQLNGRGYYVVQRGDTLSEIANRYGMDYRQLARYNDIRQPYVILYGQKLWLHDRGRTYASAPSAAAKSGRGANSGRSSRRAAKQSAPVSAGHWAWPTKGQVVSGYSASGKINKGINISGQNGQVVTAARSGEVMYAGEGIKSYGLLVIIKHDERFISAYAYNRKSYVREGDKVKQGQKIAQMGTRQGGQAQLHFEIRRDGKPVDPRTFLPKR